MLGMQGRKPFSATPGAEKANTRLYALIRPVGDGPGRHLRVKAQTSLEMPKRGAYVRVPIDGNTTPYAFENPLRRRSKGEAGAWD